MKLGGFGKTLAKGRTPPNMNKRQKEALRGKFSDALMSTDLMVSTILEWYDAKHRKPLKEEVDFINSIGIE